ncbi:MAG TPA: helical backbone metal receptor, partial [Gemmatimonadaceae bacterium]|nr:helical backbone metal receptor [Gemmatimonadaceae bacterium]
VVGVAALGACAERDAPAAAVERDDFGAPVITTSAPPARIVSLDPTITELFFALGGGGRLVGRTHWDLWPDSARFVPDLGPGIQPSVEAVLATRPDLVVLYGGEDNRGAARQLAAAGVRVLAFRVDRIADFQRVARVLGGVIGRPRTADSVIAAVDSALEHVRAATRGLERPTVFWHAWDTPLITIGAPIFRSELLEIAGGRNIYADLRHPSPQVSLEDVVRRNPQVIIAAPHSAERIRSDAAWQSIDAVRNGRVIAVDETALSSPSVRMGRDAALLARLLHPRIPL